MLLSEREQDQLREFLVETLKPISEADPTVLAKYVLALLKNTKSREELRFTCAARLEEFLSEGTAGFVDKLFRKLDSEYPVGAGAEEPHSQGKDQPAGAENVLSYDDEGPDVEDEDEEEEEDDRNHKHRRSKRGEAPAERRRHISSVIEDPSAQGGGRRDSDRGARDRPYVRGTRGRYGNANMMGGPLGHMAGRGRLGPHAMGFPPPPPPLPPPPLPPPLPLSESPSTANQNLKHIPCPDYNKRGFCMKGDFCPYSHGAKFEVMADASRLPVQIQQSETHKAYVPEQPPWGGPPGAPPQGPSPGYSGRTGQRQRQHRTFSVDDDTITAIDTSGGAAQKPRNHSGPWKGNQNTPGNDNGSRNRNREGHFKRGRRHSDDEEDEEDIPAGPSTGQKAKRMRFLDGGERPSAKFTLRLRFLPLQYRNEAKIRSKMSKFGAVLRIRPHQKKEDEVFVQYEHEEEVEKAKKADLNAVFGTARLRVDMALFDTMDEQEAAETAKQMRDNGELYRPPTKEDLEALKKAKDEKDRAERDLEEKRKREKEEKATELEHLRMKKKELLLQQIEQQKRIVQKLAQSKPDALENPQNNQERKTDTASGTGQVLSEAPDGISKQSPAGPAVGEKVVAMEAQIAAMKARLAQKQSNASRASKAPQIRLLNLGTLALSGDDDDTVEGRLQRLTEHFSEFGKVTVTVEEANNDHALIQFESSSEAADAMVKGRKFGEGALNLQWYKASK